MKNSGGLLSCEACGSPKSVIAPLSMPSKGTAEMPFVSPTAAAPPVYGDTEGVNVVQRARASIANVSEVADVSASMRTLLSIPAENKRSNDETIENALLFLSEFKARISELQKFLHRYLSSFWLHVVPGPTLPQLYPHSAAGGQSGAVPAGDQRAPGDGQCADL